MIVERPAPRPLRLHRRQLLLPRLGRDLAAAAAAHLDVVEGPGRRARERRELLLLLLLLLPLWLGLLRGLRIRVLALLRPVVMPPVLLALRLKCEEFLVTFIQ